MSQANDLLDTLPMGEGVVYSADPATEEHIVIDGNRVISVPGSLRDIAVQFDHNIETVTFDCPRFWDGHDLSQMKVYINYRRADGKTDKYLADNVTVDATDENIMHFDWTISRKVTEVKGNISFLVCVKRVDADGNEERHWNSKLCSDLSVAEGLECDEIILEENPDIITQILLRLDEVESSGGGGGTGSGHTHENKSVLDKFGVNYNGAYPTFKANDLTETKQLIFLEDVVTRDNSLHQKIPAKAVVEGSTVTFKNGVGTGTDLFSLELPESYTPEEIDEMISRIPKFAIEVVDALPETDISDTTVYLVKDTETNGNLYTEYIYVNNAWECLGSQQVDLTGYAKEEDIPTKTSQLENDSGFVTKADIPTDESYEFIGQTPLMLEKGGNIKLVADGETSYSMVSPTVWNFDNAELTFTKCSMSTDKGYYEITAGDSLTAYHQSYVQIQISGLEIGKSYTLLFDINGLAYDVSNKNWNGTVTLWSGTTTSTVIQSVRLDREKYTFTATDENLLIRYYPAYSSAATYDGFIGYFNKMYLNYTDAPEELTEIYSNSGTFTDVATFKGIPEKALITTDPTASVYKKATDFSQFIEEAAASVNLYVPATDGWTNNAFITSNGQPTVNDTSYKGYLVTPPLPVIGGKTYTVKPSPFAKSAADINKARTYDFKGAPLAAMAFTDNADGSSTFTVPDGSETIRLSVLKMSFGSSGDPVDLLVTNFNKVFMLVEGTTAPEQYVPYGKGDYRLKDIEIPEKSVKLSKLDDEILPIFAPLAGKKIVNFGDSIFGNARPPEDVSTFLAKKTGAEVLNCAFGGCRMSIHVGHWDAFSMYRLAYSIANNDFALQDEAMNYDDRTSYAEEPLALIKTTDFSKVDIVTIGYGTNDFTGNNTLDNSENPLDTSTVCGALRYSIEQLLTAYPNLKIFVLSTTYRFWIDKDNGNAFLYDSSTYTNANNVKLTDCNAKLKEVAEEYNLPFIDNYNIGINQFNRLQYFPVTDGTHHNETGRKLIASHLAKELY